MPWLYLPIRQTLCPAILSLPNQLLLCIQGPAPIQFLRKASPDLLSSAGEVSEHPILGAPPAFGTHLHHETQCLAF